MDRRSIPLAPSCADGQEYYECAIGPFTGCCSHNPCETGSCSDSVTTVVQSCTGDGMPTSTVASFASTLQSNAFGGLPPTTQTETTRKSLTTSFTTKMTTGTGDPILSNINSDLSSASTRLHSSNTGTGTTTSTSTSSLLSSVSKSVSHASIIAVVVVVLVVALALAILICCCIRRRRKKQSGGFNINFNRNKTTKEQIRVIRNNSDDERQRAVQMERELQLYQVHQARTDRERSIDRGYAAVLEERQETLGRLEGRDASRGRSPAPSTGGRVRGPSAVDAHKVWFD